MVNKKFKKGYFSLLSLVFLLGIWGVGCSSNEVTEKGTDTYSLESSVLEETSTVGGVLNFGDGLLEDDVVVDDEYISNVLDSDSFDFSSIPEYSGSPYYVVNDNTPFFEESELTTQAFEKYSDLDDLGRCGVCVASVGAEIMPSEERGSIGQVKPSGWHTVKYDCVDGKYLYNRCHLIGYQLTGENANTKNLITGTRYLNIDGMLPFENMVDDYVEETGNHVMYRVTPIYEGSNLVASGVLMEGYSVEDNGEGICYNVYCYNAQPGVSINYADGSSSLEGTESGAVSSEVSEVTPTVKPTEEVKELHENQIAEEPEDGIMVWKSATGDKYHAVNDCGRMNPSKAVEITKEEAESSGLEPCKKCF